VPGKRIPCGNDNKKSKGERKTTAKTNAEGAEELRKGREGEQATATADSLRE
jgi:hypothetical protein